jgi:hypothetical protein
LPEMALNGPFLSRRLSGRTRRVRLIANNFSEVMRMASPGKLSGPSGFS